MSESLNQKLLTAAQKGHHKKIQALIDLGADVNAFSGRMHGASVLEFAIESGNIDAVRVLLDNGADVNRKNGKYRGTPLGSALSRRKQEIAELLIERGADLNDLNEPSLMSVICSNFYLDTVDTVKMLVERGANVNCNYACAGTPLMASIRHSQNNYELLRYLLEKGADINQSLYGDHRTILTELKGSKDDRVRDAIYVIESTLGKHGLFGVEEKTKENEHVFSLNQQLIFACMSGNTESIKLLIDQGADVNAKVSSVMANFFDISQNYTPMMALASRNDVDNMTVLQANGASAAGALVAAVKHGKLEAANFLVENKETFGIQQEIDMAVNDISAQFKLHKTPMAELLIGKGNADLNSKGDGLYTSLQMAITHHDPALVKIMVEKGGVDIKALHDFLENRVVSEAMREFVDDKMGLSSLVNT